MDALLRVELIKLITCDELNIRQYWLYTKIRIFVVSDILQNYTGYVMCACRNVHTRIFVFTEYYRHKIKALKYY